MMKQTNNDSTSEQKYAIEKHLYKKNWNIDHIDEEFLDKWYRKTYILNNLKDLLGINNLNEIMTIDNDKQYINFDKAKQKQRIELIKDLIVKMGFCLNNIGKDISLTRETFESNIELCLKECKLFTNPKLTDLLFRLNQVILDLQGLLWVL